MIDSVKEDLKSVHNYLREAISCANDSAHTLNNLAGKVNDEKMIVISNKITDAYFLLLEVYDTMWEVIDE